MKAEYIDHMGTDLSVVNAARVSFDNQSEWDHVNDDGVEHDDDGWRYTDPTDMRPRDEYTGYLRVLKEKDANLIGYLARGLKRSEWKDKLEQIMTVGAGWHASQGNMRSGLYNDAEWLVEELMIMAQHWVPFTHTSISLRMEAPVPIRTQAFKHKVGFTESEESRRYIKSRPVLFIPDNFRMAAADVKQGSGGIHPDSADWLSVYTLIGEVAILHYEKMLAAGVCAEQARFILPQGCEVKWVWTGNLASYARYYNNRTDPHAQKEGADLAEAVGKIIEPLFPVSWPALTRGKAEDAPWQEAKEAA